MELLYLLGFNFILTLILVPTMIWVHNDTFGHYMRPYAKHYVHRADYKPNILVNDTDMGFVRAECNPFLSAFKLAKYEPPIVEWKFEDDEVREAWERLNG